jgi:hypothetical protein
VGVHAKRSAGFNAVRLKLATYLALAFEFQLGADILSTAIADLAQDRKARRDCNHSDRAKLFLMREMAEERQGGQANERTLNRE